MAGRIPLVIQIEIFCRLPVKSLIRMTPVSKEWKCLIQSSDFNYDYIVRQSHRQRLLVGYENYKCCEDDETRHFCSIVDDDDTFPRHKVSLIYPKLLENMNALKLLGSSHGLLCFSGYYRGEYDYFHRYVIWNPSIKKSVAIDVPYYKSVFVAFGVCRNTLDPKIVSINVVEVPSEYEYCDYDDNRTVWRVKVFTLRSGVWRSPLIKLPSKWMDIEFWGKTPLVINGFIYWCAFISMGYRKRFYMIISFDLTSEEFTKIHVPDKLAHEYFYIFKLGESLAVVKHKSMGCYRVWLMDHASKSFTKLFNVKLPPLDLWIVGFRNNHQLMMVANHKELVAYEPCLKQFNDLEIYGDWRSFSLSSYTESLLLIDQSGTINDDEGDAQIARCGDQKSCNRIS